MRLFRAVIVASISLLVVGLQAAPGPYALCKSQCEDAETGEVIEMICWSGPSQSGCAILEDAPACGVCEDASVEVTGACCVADASCPPVETCRQLPDGKDQCPYSVPDCFWCLPDRVLAINAPQSDLSRDKTLRLLSPLASDLLTQSDLSAQATHAHSPPGPILAQSSSETCIEICLLLI